MAVNTDGTLVVIRTIKQAEELFKYNIIDIGDNDLPYDIPF
jgi:hypothetical protein